MPILCVIYNMSLKTSVLPQTWKLTIVGAVPVMSGGGIIFTFISDSVFFTLHDYTCRANVHKFSLFSGRYDNSCSTLNSVWNVNNNDLTCVLVYCPRCNFRHKSARHPTFWSDYIFLRRASRCFITEALYVQRLRFFYRYGRIHPRAVDSVLYEWILPLPHTVNYHLGCLRALRAPPLIVISIDKDSHRATCNCLCLQRADNIKIS